MSDDATPDANPGEADLVQAVVDAWTVEGPEPLYHQTMQVWLNDKWPVLAAALDALAGSRR
jgi:hypothetical protein